MAECRLLKREVYKRRDGFIRMLENGKEKIIGYGVNFS